MPVSIKQSGDNKSTTEGLLEKILDKGIVIVGDVALELVGVELLTIRLRLLIASTERAEELGIGWWKNDPFLTAPGETKKELIKQTVQETLKIALNKANDSETDEQSI